jgi:hypothetical protein
MTKVVNARAVGITGCSQAHLMGYLHEGFSKGGVRYMRSLVGKKEARATRIWKKAIPKRCIALQRSLRGCVNGDISTFAELGVTDGEHATAQIHIVAMKP